jgi:ElaA protein
MSVDAMHRSTGDALTAATLYALLTLRVDVFVVEQQSPYPDLDGRDLQPDTVHFWFADAERVLACLRLLTEPDGTARIGRICTAPAARGAGLSSRLMAAALAEVGPRPAVLDAQVQLREYYARYGFEVVSEPFDDGGVLHVVMRRPARPS